MNDNSLFKNIDGVTYTSDMRTLVVCSHERKGKIVIPEGVEVIKESAFSDCHIRSVVMPDSLKKIEKWAFIYCHELECVDFGKGITKIGIHGVIDNDTFMRCNNLKHVVIPSQVKVIERGVFSHSGLESITLQEGLETIHCNVFTYCKDLKSIRLPESLNILDSQDDNHISYIEMKTVPNHFVDSILSNYFGSERVQTINLNGMRIFVPSIMTGKDKVALGRILQQGNFTDDFICRTYRFASRNDIRRSEIICMTYNEALKNGNSYIISELRNKVTEVSEMMVRYFLEKDRVEDAIMVINFGLMSKHRILSLMEKVKNPVVRACLLENIPDAGASVFII